MAEFDGLPLPPSVDDGLAEIEIVRAVKLKSGGQEFVARQIWDDPGAWGVLAVDLLRHASKIYEVEKGYSSDLSFQRMCDAFIAECKSSTGDS